MAFPENMWYAIIVRGTYMRLEQITQVLELARTGSMSRTAESLFITQPNLSVSLRKLEEEIGHEIFSRSSKGLTLTDFGREFLKYAVAINDDFRNMQDFCTFSTHPVLSLSVGLSSQVWLYAVLGELLEENADKTLSFNLPTYDDVYSMVDDIKLGRIEMGVPIVLDSLLKHLRPQLKNEGVEYHSLCSESFSIIARKEHPLFREFSDSVPMERLKDYPIVIIGNDRSPAHRKITERAGFLKDTAKSVITVSTGGSMHSILEHSDAIAFSVHYTKAYEKYPYNPALRSAHIADVEMKFELGWIKMAQTNLSDTAALFVKKLEETCR